jgi:deazaflavin-dependent oxidoreductase (nitroreductase family)
MPTRSPAEWQNMNDPVVAEFRSSGGQVTGRFAGRPLLLLTTIGRKSGTPRVAPLNYSTDGDRVVVIASKGGSPSHPDWYHNIVANPEVTIELGSETFRARGRTAEEPERSRLFAQQAAEMPFFAAYEREVTARRIPVVVFDRID